MDTAIKIACLEASAQWRYQDERAEWLRSMQDLLTEGLLSPVEYSEQVLSDWQRFCKENMDA